MPNKPNISELRRRLRSKPEDTKWVIMNWPMVPATPGRNLRGRIIVTAETHDDKCNRLVYGSSRDCNCTPEITHHLAPAEYSKEELMALFSAATNQTKLN
jgi:hypothetical protein